MKIDNYETHKFYRGDTGRRKRIKYLAGTRAWFGRSSLYVDISNFNFESMKFPKVYTSPEPIIDGEKIKERILSGTGIDKPKWKSAFRNYPPEKLTEEDKIKIYGN